MQAHGKRSVWVWWALCYLLLVPAVFVIRHILQATGEVDATARIKKIGGGAYRDQSRPGSPVTRVYLCGSDYEDDVIDYVEGFQQLEFLDLSSTHITDAGLSRIAHLRSLRELRLSTNPQITDAGLFQLSRLSMLEHLDVHSTGVTASGIADLQAALPGLQIEWEPP